MYNDKGNTKYLKLLKQNYSSSQDVIREIVNLSAIINLPKGTEFFLGSTKRPMIKQQSQTGRL